MHALFEGVRRSLDFRGSMRRGRYWVHVTTLVLTVAMLGGLLERQAGKREFEVLVVLVTLFALVSIASATVRRLHDTGRRWPCLLVSIVPFVGPLVLLVWLCGASTGEDEPLATQPSEVAFGEKARAWALRSSPWDHPDYEAIRLKHGGFLERMLKAQELRLARRSILTNVIACPNCGTSTSYPSHVGARSHDCPYCRTSFSARYNEDGSLASAGKR